MTNTFTIQNTTTGRPALFQRNGVGNRVASGGGTNAPQIILPAANRFIDNLEGGLKNASDPTGINVDGFTWASSNGIPFSIVNSSGYVIVDANGNVTNTGPFPERQWENAPDGTVGTNAFRARYPGMNTQFAEQRFNLGADYPTLWMRWWVRVPINYVHVDVLSVGENNKWHSIWQDGYEGAGLGGMGTWELRPTGGSTADTGDSYLNFKSKAGLNSGGVGGDTLLFHDFIRWPEDRGRWMQCVIQFSVSSAANAPDAVMRFYRRWENEGSWTLCQENTTLVINVPEGYTGFRNGWFMGANNSGYSADTEFLIDRVEISTTSLV